MRLVYYVSFLRNHCSHWTAGLRVLRYLKDTCTYGITYTSGGQLRGFCDSDWAGDSDSRRSTTGYCFMLASSVISWLSKKQLTMALSSTEAEYRAACIAACEALWLRRILGNMDMTQKDATTLLCDNQSCIAIAKNPVFHARTDRKSTRLNSSHSGESRMPSSA